MLKSLDIFFVVFHAALTLFNLFGWAWKPTRKANLLTLLLTFGAWFGLGIFFGIGYCPLTDWHFRILEKMGQTNLPNSYITYIIHRLIGQNPPERLVDIFTVTLFFLAFFISLFLNLRKNFKKVLLVGNYHCHQLFLLAK
jgi:hypothetical protein